MKIQNFHKLIHRPAGFGYKLATRSTSLCSEMISENMTQLAIKYSDIRVKQAQYSKNLSSLDKVLLLTS